jgi:hypothetical protein
MRGNCENEASAVEVGRGEVQEQVLMLMRAAAVA